MRKAILSILLTALIAFSGFPEGSFLNVLDPEIASELRSEERLTNTFWRGESCLLIPEVDRSEAVKNEIKSLDPTISVEVLTVYEQKNLNLESPEAMLAIYNILLSVSTMEGIDYYSARRGRMRTLFAESYCIDSPENQKKLHDPEVSEIPPFARLYVFQKDLTFGENLYRSEYYFGGDYILMKTLNLTTYRYFLVPMVQPKDIITYFILIPCGEKLLFYGLTSAHTISLFGLEKTREPSFYNRLKAIYGWFVRRMEEELL